MNRRLFAKYVSLVVWFFLLSCAAISNSCRPNTSPHSEGTLRSASRQMLEIQRTEVTEHQLIVMYRVNNLHSRNIWICEDILDRNDENAQDVATNIVDGTTWIRLRFCLQSNMMTGPVTARYRRLPPGQSHSGKIILALPLRDASPVYSFRFSGGHRTPILAHRAVFELGFFTEDLDAMLYEPPKDRSVESFAVVSKKDPDALLVCHLWAGLEKEESARCVIEDIDIPCVEITGRKETR